MTDKKDSIEAKLNGPRKGMYDLFEPLVSRTNECYYNRILNPSQKRSQRGLVLSSFNYASQPPLQRHKASSKLGKHLTHLERSLGNLHRNLNYASSIKDWREFYKFPNASQTQIYADELKAYLGGVEKPFIVNQNARSVKRYEKSIVALFEDERCNISFLNGTTGVGKTTFLKYFTKTRKSNFLDSKILLSRVKFRELESLYEPKSRQNSVALNDVFAQYVIDCLVRDIFDSYRVADLSGSEEVFGALEGLEEIIAFARKYFRTTFGSSWGEKLDQIVGGDVSVITLLSSEFKRDFVMLANRYLFKFCIILDGFDAIRPEEIQLFGDAKQGVFFQCLSAVIREQFQIDTPEGMVINALNKTIVIAARPTTIFQLKEEIQDEVDFDHVFNHEVYVLGSDLYGIIENRIRLFYSTKTNTLAPPSTLIEIIKGCISKVIDVLYDEHEPVLERGRFINLFNHNIREKLVFIRSVLQYMIVKIDETYEKSRLFSITDGRLTVTEFSELLSLEPGELGIDLYEVQKLLILPKDGEFKNHFRYSTSEELVPSFPKGPFDNIFNYVNSRSRLNYEKAKSSGWKIEMDPVLSKFLILYYLTTRPEHYAPVTTIGEWFEDEFKHLLFDPIDLKLLIRAGYVEIRRIKSSPHTFLTRKGEFLVKELIYSEIYLEHVVLNTRLPLYISDLIKPPQSPELREWGRVSIVNVIVFLMYLKQVSQKIVLTKDVPIMNVIDRVFDSVKDSFPRVISEGLREEGAQYGIILARELIRITNSSKSK